MKLQTKTVALKTVQNLQQLSRQKGSTESTCNDRRNNGIRGNSDWNEMDRLLGLTASSNLHRELRAQNKRKPDRQRNMSVGFKSDFKRRMRHRNDT
mmetsp:Transcript_48145/g.77119  ORF Transcript_48145/g.77119 Transcript_48145/m.77119 type:complete len:96 (-) Transcript_48145:35-322(-)